MDFLYIQNPLEMQPSPIMAYRPLILMLLSFALLVRCSPEKTGHTQEAKSDLQFSTQQELLIDNPKLIAFVREYIDATKDGPPRIYMILANRENIDVYTYQIGCIGVYNPYNDATGVPHGYFTIDDELVLVYSGLEHLSTPSESYKRNLYSIVSARISTGMLADGKTIDPDFSPMIYCPPTYEITFDRDSVIETRGVFNLLGPRLVDAIKFVTPQPIKK